LTRATTRRRELAIRAALGASARDLRRQMIVEASVIGAAGGAAGLALTAVLVRILPAVLPADFPRAADVAVNIPVLVFVVAASVATSVACGMFPALEGAWVDVTHALAEEGAASAGASSRSAAGRVRALAMVAQVAVACLLLVGAALLARSFVALMHADRGFEPANVLSARVDLPRQYTPPQRVAFLDAVSARLSATPGVVAAAGGNALPFVSMGGVAAFRLPSPTDPAIKVSVQATTRIVGPDYLKALRLRLVSGRWLLDSDTASTRSVVVVSRSFARKYLGDRVLGVRIPMSFAESASPDADVVGVVDDMRQDTVLDAAMPELFISYRQTPVRLSTFPAVFVVRTSDDPMRHVQGLRTAVREQDPSVPVDSVMTMEERVATSLAKPRLYALLLTGFAAAALAIAAVGLFGVLSYAVAQRAREIGVRTALGAQVRDIVVLVLRQALVVTGVGVGAGLVGAFVLTRYLSAFLYGVGRADPGSYIAVGVTVALVAAAACVVPARRAARVDPIAVLRQT
jgi:predicted permease